MLGHIILPPLCIDHKLNPTNQQPNHKHCSQQGQNRGQLGIIPVASIPHDILRWNLSMYYLSSLFFFHQYSFHHCKLTCACLSVLWPGSPRCTLVYFTVISWSFSYKLQLYRKVLNDWLSYREGVFTRCWWAEVITDRQNSNGYSNTANSSDTLSTNTIELSKNDRK